METMKFAAVALALGAAALLPAQQNPVLGEEPVKISDHVWALMGWPNIGIVVGDRATLVVDTGLGPRNGATIAKVAAKLAPNNRLYLTTTHFHPEHAAGDNGFPPNAILIRNAVQQQEMVQHGEEMIHMFAGRNAQWKELLSEVKLRQPDISFTGEELALDLGGGVSAQLLWFGGAHTKGDELTFILPDRTLVSGDVVQNKTAPNIYGDGGTPSSWLAVVDKIAALNVQHVLPDHSAPGDGSLVTQEKTLISELRTKALALKKQGVSAEDAGKQLSAEMKMNVTAFVKSIYNE
jgi:glyoxylase-like metal-dependent hydrolase (beta-lactamase superfamily II)